MGRLVGIDYGKARLGIAISDETKFLARPLATLDNNKLVFEKLRAELKSYKIDAIVLGLPLLLSGKESPMSLEVKQFAEQLKAAFPLPVILWDERLTTSQVDRSLRDLGVNRKKRDALSDTHAAALILQSYLDLKGGV